MHGERWLTADPCIGNPFEEVDMKHDIIDSVKMKVRVTDLLFPDRKPLVFDSLADCAKYFGKSRSWLSQRFKRAEGQVIEYAECRIEVVR